MVPDVNKKAMRNGRAAATRLSGAATKASNKIKVVKTLSLLWFVAMAALYHGAALDGKENHDPELGKEVGKRLGSHFFFQSNLV